MFALDLGTSKFCIGYLNSNHHYGAKVIETVCVQADGMKRGMLADFEKACSALEKLLSQAEKDFQNSIERVIVGVAGSHLQSSIARCSISLRPTIIQKNVLDQLSKKVEEEHQQDSKVLLHVVPVSYQVDMREPVENPIGFSGTRLAGDFFLVYADKAYVKDVIRLCNQNGLAVERLYSEPLASASVTVEEPLKHLGVAVADIGGGTTDGVVFQNGKPFKLFSVNLAGHLMTNDLAIGLNLPYEEAEKVKILFGIHPAEKNRSLEVIDIYGHKKTISWAQAYNILAPRIQELGALMAKQLKESRGGLGGGVLFTGGGSEIKGLCSFLEQRFHVPVHKSQPVFQIEKKVLTSTTDNHHQYSNKFATVLGLINLEIGRLQMQNVAKEQTLSHRYLSQFVNWLKEMS